jgi:hypothetical protein
MYANKEGSVKIFSSGVQWPLPGTIVSVPTYVVFRHKGIVSDRWCRGMPMVISNSARVGAVSEEPWDVFTSGQSWKNEGYPGNLKAWEVLYRARSAPRLQYNAFTWNCEGFVAHCHGLPPTSPQLAAVVIVALVGAAIIARS